MVLASKAKQPTSVHVGFSDRILVVAVTTTSVEPELRPRRPPTKPYAAMKQQPRPPFQPQDQKLLLLPKKKSGYVWPRVLLSLSSSCLHNILIILGLALLTTIVILFLLPTTLLRRDYSSCPRQNHVSSSSMLDHDWIKKAWINGPPPTWKFRNSNTYIYVIITYRAQGPTMNTYVTKKIVVSSDLRRDYSSCPLNYVYLQGLMSTLVVC